MLTPDLVLGDVDDDEGFSDGAMSMSTTTTTETTSYPP